MIRCTNRTGPGLQELKKGPFQNALQGCTEVDMGASIYQWKALHLVGRTGMNQDDILLSCE